MRKLCCVCTRQQFSASLDYFVTSSPPYFHQFSSISGGNCINVNKILESYERMFKEKPRKSRLPLMGGDHPELDTSELCDEHQTKQFQTLIGQLQWLISLGHFYIAVHVMSLSRFRAQPRKGHLDRAKRIVGYLLFLTDGAIRFRTGEPDFSSLKDQEYDWTRSVYSGACEQIPHDIPKPLGKHVQTTHYEDANLHHDLWKSCHCSSALPKPNTN